MRTALALAALLVLADSPQAQTCAAPNLAPPP